MIQENIDLDIAYTAYKAYVSTGQEADLDRAWRALLPAIDRIQGVHRRRVEDHRGFLAEKLYAQMRNCQVKADVSPTELLRNVKKALTQWLDERVHDLLDEEREKARGVPTPKADVRALDFVVASLDRSGVLKSLYAVLGERFLFFVAAFGGTTIQVPTLELIERMIRDATIVTTFADDPRPETAAILAERYQVPVAEIEAVWARAKHLSDVVKECQQRGIEIRSRGTRRKKQLLAKMRFGSA